MLLLNNSFGNVNRNSWHISERSKEQRLKNKQSKLPNKLQEKMKKKKKNNKKTKNVWNKSFGDIRHIREQNNGRQRFEVISCKSPKVSVCNNTLIRAAGAKGKKKKNCARLI